MPNRPSFLSFVVSTAVLISLGWGLRGYIGGGPLGAMIPGAYLALWLCLLLGIEGKRASVITAFAAAGIGFGGEMTYGQTLGFLRSDDTVLWGVLGTIVKGGVWGLLGGAMLGLGFIADRLTFRQVAIGLGLALAGMALGLLLINQPRLIYFSDPLNKPRNETWAGLLFAAIALLVWLRAIHAGAVPLRFALFGLAGGMAGFGIGGVEMAFGFRLEPPLNGLPWWKCMEFTFGACLGIAYGACAWTLRDVIKLSDKAEQPRAAVPTALLPVAAIYAGAILLAWNYSAEPLIESVSAWPGEAIVMPIALVLLGFATFASVLALISLRSETLAWQFAITMTFAATVLDLSDDLAQGEGAPVSAAVRWLMLLVPVIACALLMLRWQRSERSSLAPVLIGLALACTAVAFARLLFQPQVLEGEGMLLARYLGAVWNSRIVHGVFAAFTVYTVAAVVRKSKAAATPCSATAGG
ncbi:MAG: hypothetical protein GC168_01620 [Candidatus Hydrogenedens sp.]|nr:hypothetical protein [Candidatus Hydrogenedens sp.]